MNENIVSTRSPARVPVAALIGAGVLIASLGAAAGWMVHSANTPQGSSESSHLALGPNESVVPPSAGTPTAATPPQQPLPAPVQSATSPAHSAAPHRHAAGATPQTAANTGTAGSGGATTQLATRPVATCNNCGVVEGVRAVQRKGQGSGVGMVAGGVVGGALGNTMGHGNGRAAMTVLGAIGGGLAGNEVEKRMHTETVYEVRVRLDDGSVRTLTERTAPTPGARVVVEGNSLRAVSSGNGGAATGGMQQTSADGRGV